MAMLWGIDRFRPYLWGRTFTLSADCNSLTWLFKGQNLVPKLHRWALRHMTLKWRLGTDHQLLDSLSWLPGDQEPGTGIDDSFPDDRSKADPGDNHLIGSQLDGVLLRGVEAGYPEASGK